MSVELPNKKERMSVEEARGFVRQVLYRIEPRERGDLEKLPARCIDGRYERDGHLAPLARAGADVGYLQVALGVLNYLKINSPDARTVALAAVLQTVGGKENFHYHSSDDEKNNSSLSEGCGHFKVAKKRAGENRAEDYELTEDDIKFIEKSLTEMGGKAHRVVLHGSHNEQAAFFVESDKYSLQAQNLEGRSALVWQKTLDEARLKKLAGYLLPFIHNKKPNIDGVEKAWLTVAAISKMQFSATLDAIAKDLPKFNVAVDESGTFNISEIPT